MKKDYDVALRGHHLIALSRFIVNGEDNFRELMLKCGYGEEHTEYVINMFKKITKFDIRIKIIDTLDDICEKCFRERESEECSSLDDAIDDRRIAANLWLSADRIYSSKYILKEFKTAHRNRLSIFYRQKAKI